MAGTRKPLMRLRGEVKSPPFTAEGRIAAGVLLARLQEGEKLSMPRSRPMPSIGPRCHELRVPDGKHNWRIVYRLDPDAVLIAGVFPKATNQTPKHQIATCRHVLAEYDAAKAKAGFR